MPTNARRCSLDICPECDSRLVQPQSIEMWGEGSWWLELRCPECDWIAADVFGQEDLAGLEKELARGHERLATDLMKLVRTNMSEYVDRFVLALAANAIHPMVFCPQHAEAAPQQEAKPTHTY